MCNINILYCNEIKLIYIYIYIKKDERIDSNRLIRNDKRNKKVNKKKSKRKRKSLREIKM